MKHVLFFVVAALPFSLAAQSKNVPRAVEVYAGWQQPLGSLRNDSISVERTGAMTAGLAAYTGANSSVMWRFVADIAFSSVEGVARSGSYNFTRPGNRAHF